MHGGSGENHLAHRERTVCCPQKPSKEVGKNKTLSGGTDQ